MEKRITRLYYELNEPQEVLMCNLDVVKVHHNETTILVCRYWEMKVFKFANNQRTKRVFINWMINTPLL